MRKFILISCFLLYSFLVFSQSKPIVFNSTVKYDTIKDSEGNTYKTVRIGNQIWMAENLRSFYDRNSNIINESWVNFIPKKNKSIDQESENLPYNPDEESAFQGEEEKPSFYLTPEFYNTYGLLYTYDEALSEAGVCPIGWHIPSMQEWNVLIEYLGGADIATVKLKETGISHWEIGSDATNSSGFTALPSSSTMDAIVNSENSYNYVGTSTFWWASDSGLNSEEFGESNLAKAIRLNNLKNQSYVKKDSKVSIRCIKN